MSNSKNQNIPSIAVPEDSRSPLVGSVEFAAVSKRFKKTTIRKKGSYTTVKSSFLDKLFGRDKQPTPKLVALDNLSLSVKPGDALGDYRTQRFR